MRVTCNGHAVVLTADAVVVPFNRILHAGGHVVYRDACLISPRISRLCFAGQIHPTLVFLNLIGDDGVCQIADAVLQHSLFCCAVIDPVGWRADGHAAAVEIIAVIFLNALADRSNGIMFRIGRSQHIRPAVGMGG